jgi:hypothetical protein
MNIVGEATSHDQLVDLLRARQESLQLSNEVLDHLALFTSGHSDKLLGPSRSRGLSQISLDSLLSSLALKLLVVEDEQQAERMRSRWEGRDQRQVRLSTTRIAKATLRHATPHVVRELGRRGGLNTWRKIPDSRLRSRLMSELAKLRWRAQRSASAPVSQETADAP